MNRPGYCRAGVLAAGLLVLTGCAGLPAQTAADPGDASAGWCVAAQRPNNETHPSAASAGPIRDRVRLGEITVARAAGGSDDDALEDLRSALAEQLRRGLIASDDAALILNVRLLDATPVSPVANAITGALFFVPLDTGSIVVEAELLSLDGERIATRRERVRGEYLDVGASLSRWGRVRNALEKWAQRCLDETAPRGAQSSNVS